VTHHASTDFWACYRSLPAATQRLADDAFARLKVDPRHPGLHFKRVGRFWSVRIGVHYRALAVDVSDGCLWFWIGTHAVYDSVIG
jgi:hypothetical protein